MFIPGETVAHEFIIPFISSEVIEVLVTYKQNDRVVLKKTITSNFEEVPENKTKITIALSQQESLLFDDKNDAEIQLNVMCQNGTRAACKEFKVSTGKQHYRQVISDGE